MIAAVVAIGLLLLGTALSWTAWTGSQRRLTPNSLLGLPLPAARSSESNWYAAHEAAAGPLGLAGGIALTCGVGVATVGFDLVGQLLAAVGLTLTLVCVVVAFVSAQRAALSRDRGSGRP